MTHKGRLHCLTTDLMISHVNMLTFQQPIVVLFMSLLELLLAESDTSELFLNLLKGGKCICSAHIRAGL